MPVAKPRKKAVRRAEIAELVSPQAARKAERKIRNHLMVLDEVSEERENYVQTILAVNPASTEETVDFIVQQLQKMRPKAHQDTILIEGQTYRLVGGEAEMMKKIEERGFRYIAIRILVACAEWDIRIGDFTLPPHNCARCGKKVGR